MSHRVAVSAITEVPVRDEETLYRKAAHSTRQNRSLRTRKGKSTFDFGKRHFGQKNYTCQGSKLRALEPSSPRAQVACVMEYIGS